MINRYVALDSLRGVAALTVFAHHSIIISPYVWDVEKGAAAPLWAFFLVRTPIHWLWGGYEAVLVFFVLSGFVLSLPFWRGGSQSYFRFVLKRIFRIYPAVIIAMAVTITLALVAPATHEYYSDWFRGYWRDIPDTSQIINELTLVAHVDGGLNAPLWSLVHEIRVSLVFPILIWVMRKCRILAVPMFFGVSVLCAYASMMDEQAPIIRSFLDTGRYLWTFVLGAEIARQLPKFLPMFEALSRRAILWNLLLASIILHFRWVPGVPKLMGSLAMCIGAGFLVVLIATRPPRLLFSPVLQFFGNISYSLYLIHFPLIVFSVKWAQIHDMWGIVPLLVFPVSVFLSVIMYRFIELPGMACGKFLLKTRR